MAKDKRYFSLIEIGFITKKENKLHLFYSIPFIFYLIPKIYFKQNEPIGSPLGPTPAMKLLTHSLML